MRKTLLATLCFLLVIASQSQKPVPSFGRIPVSDLQMKNCAFEPDANAMVLFDVEETDFDMYTFSLRLKSERRVRIKIFNEKGYKHATIRIPYFSKKGVAKIKELNGIVYTLGNDGEIKTQKLEKKDFFKEKAIENVGFVSFTFPNVKPGCVIEYSYTTVENNIYSIATWNIQDKIPVAYTSKIVTTPVECRLVERPYGIDSLKNSWYLSKGDRYRTLTYYHENVPSFKVEPFMTSINDHRIKATFRLFLRGASIISPNNRSDTKTMWALAGRNFIQSVVFGDFIQKVIPGTEKIIDTAKKITVIKDRIGFLYGELKKQIPEKSEQAIVGESLEEAWKNKTGSSFEINLILLNLLLKSDVACMPVMVSTRENGHVKKDFPSISQFNGFDVMAFDSTTNYLLDASIKFQSYLNPPLNVLNRDVFVMGKDSSQWVTVEDKRPLLKHSMYVVADLDKEGNIDGTGSIQYFDYAKAYKLDTSLQDDESDEEFYDTKPLGLKIVSTEQGESGAEEDPLFETVEFKYETQKSDDFVFINPQILNERQKNPFIASTRNYDIDFGCNQLKVMNMQINLPAEFDVEHLPDNVLIRASDSSFLYKITYAFSAGKIQIAQFFESKRAIYSKEEYGGVKDFFQKMYTLMSKEIILKKKK